MFTELLEKPLGTDLGSYSPHSALFKKHFALRLQAYSWFLVHCSSCSSRMGDRPFIMEPASSLDLERDTLSAFKIGLKTFIFIRRLLVRAGDIEIRLGNQWQYNISTVWN